MERVIPAEVAGDVASIVESNNRFVFDIYGAVRGQPGNLFLSPYSMSTAFAMCYAGARTQTAEEMAQVFHFDLPQNTLHPAFGALQQSLDRGTSIGGYELNVANRLWGQQGQPFVTDFLDVTRVHYGAEMEMVNFEADPEGIRNHINDWVMEKTKDRIEDLFPQGSISTVTRLVLANAIYFKGTWRTQFDVDDTRDADFTIAPGQRIRVPTMHMEEMVAPFADLADLTLLELPYEGKDLAMLLLLPTRTDGLADLEANLTTENLAAWTGALQEAEVAVALPRFSFTSDYNLIPPLQSLGMTLAFSDFADFTGIRASGGLTITGAFHKAFVKVDEVGTEAAAATGIVVGETSVGPGFEADHPFLFLIQDKVTGSILFIGRVVDPSA